MVRFKGRYGSSEDDTVHGVQMDNLVHKGNTGWNSILFYACSQIVTQYNLQLTDTLKGGQL